MAENILGSWGHNELGKKARSKAAGEGARATLSQAPAFRALLIIYAQLLPLS
jgi:hypothetical protein